MDLRREIPSITLSAPLAIWISPTAVEEITDHISALSELTESSLQSLMSLIKDKASTQGP